MTKYFLSSFCFLLLSIAAFATPSITVSCPDTVRLNGMFWYEIKLTAQSYNAAKGLVFEPGTELVTYKYDQGTTTVGGKMHHTLTLRYSLRISSMGVHHLPQISIEAEGKEMVSQPTDVVVIPAPQFETGYKTAFDLLTRNGINADELHLSLKECDKSIILFSDERTGCFAAVATDKYSKLMNDGGVLAWSTEGAMRSLDKGGPDWIFKSYAKQLDALAAGTAKLYTAKGNNANVKPLLGKVAWGQDEPYNRFCPSVSGQSGKGTVAGCGPVALGQVMMYHKFPAKGKGERAYEVGGTLYRFDIGEQTFNWNKMQENYDSDEKDSTVIIPIARLIISAGVATGAQFGKERTPSNASLYRSALVNNFGYSASAHSMVGGRSEDRIRVATAELLAARPMVVGSKDHAFVLDGVQGNFMHYNMGWNGLANGWYRTLVVPDGELAFEMMVAGITPGTKDTKRQKTIKLKKPGTLASLLTPKDVETITHLTISGKLNNADVRLLRRMAGAVEDTSWNEVRGCLTHLDLSNAQFVTDRNGYFMRFTAKGYMAWRTETTTSSSTARTYVNRETFDFDKMTHDKWKAFKNYGMHKQEGYYLTEEGGQYYICCHTESGHIGYYMWSDCENLQQIQLPTNTIAIGDRAFANCTSLLRLDIPDKCKVMGTEVFVRCIAIEAVTYTQLLETPQSNFYSALREANPLTPNLTRRRR